MKKILILTLILGLLLTGCGIVPDPPEPVEITCRALLIGADDYVGCKNDLSAPPYAVDSIGELLNRCYNIEALTILKGKEATKKNILDEIWYTFKNATKDDVSIFYWAGHGGDKHNTFYLCPTDTDWTLEGNITVIELEYWLDKMKGTKIVILDGCHSGGFIEKDITKALNKPNYQVLTSCMGEQVCYQAGGTIFRDPYMIFTKGILKGCKEDYLADIDLDGIVTITEAYNFAIDWVAKNHSKLNQDAQMYPENSLFPLVRY